MINVIIINAIITKRCKSQTNPMFTAAESGVDESVRQRFPGANVKYGSGASGAGDNREIPLDEGGDINPQTGK
jgi:hypothetical protein